MLRTQTTNCNTWQLRFIISVPSFPFFFSFPLFPEVLSLLLLSGPPLCDFHSHERRGIEPFVVVNFWAAMRPTATSSMCCMVATAPPTKLQPLWCLLHAPCIPSTLHFSQWERSISKILSLLVKVLQSFLAEDLWYFFGFLGLRMLRVGFGV